MGILMSALGSNASPAFSPLTGFKKFTLDNKLTVYAKEEHKLPVGTIQLWIRAGSLDENDKNNGVSHFLEHMMFKGTKKYGVSEISRMIESNGGVTNAGTSKEFTEYYIDIPMQGFETAMDIIAEIAQNATFPAEEVDRERMVILEEIKRGEDNPQNVLFENFNKQLFTETNYKYRVIGTSESVTNMKREDIIDYYKKRYIPENMTLVVAGDFKFEQIKKLIAEKFSYLSGGGIPTNRTYLIEPVSQAGEVKQGKPVQLSYILCGFLGPELDSDRQFSGDLLSTILGGGMSSRLYQKLREQKQIVYGISSGFYSQQGPGIFYISAVCAPDKVDITLKEINNELSDILSKGVTEGELERAKEIISSHWFFDQETVHQLANVVGYWNTLDKLDIVEQYYKKVMSVSNEDVKQFLQMHYTGLTVSIINPEK